MNGTAGFSVNGRSIGAHRGSLVCPYCRSPLADGCTRRCSGCNALYHVECWREYGRCSVFGCRGTPVRDGSQLLFVPAILWSVCLTHPAIAVLFSFILAPAIVYCLLATLYYLWDLFYGLEVNHGLSRQRLRHDLLFVCINALPIILTILLR